MNKPKSYYISNYTKEELYDLVVKLEVKIDKAIEYIEKFIPIDNDTILMRSRQRDYLLEILKGDNNE